MTAFMGQKLCFMEYFFPIPSGINLPWMLLTLKHHRKGLENVLRFAKNLKIVFNIPEMPDLKRMYKDILKHSNKNIDWHMQIFYINSSQLWECHLWLTLW